MENVPKIKWATLFYLSLILGFFGADRFYAGKIISGIIKLITFGGFGVWWIVDLILIAFGKCGDKSGSIIERDRNFKKHVAISFSVLIVLAVIVNLGDTASENVIDNKKVIAKQNELPLTDSAQTKPDTNTKIEEKIICVDNIFDPCIDPITRAVIDYRTGKPISAAKEEGEICVDGITDPCIDPVTRMIIDPKTKAIKANIKVTARELFKEYEKDEIDAGEKYEGKLIEISGRIESRGKDILDRPYIILETSENIVGVQVYFHNDDDVSKLKKGQNVILLGHSKGFLFNVIIDNATIAEGK